MKKIIFVLSIVGFLLSYSHQNYSYANDVVYKSSQDDYVQISNLPTIFIDTENGVDITSKEEYVNAVVTVRGAANAEDDITEVVAEIKGRGNSTWGMAKKPYRLKFDKKINFLGNEAKEKNWVLLANYADKTLMRNALAFETTRQLFNFSFTPSVTFVDVVLNGKNIGSYLLTDQVEVKEKRVSVTEQETTVMAGSPEISGGYLIEVDGFAEKEISWFKTAKEMKITIKYPKDDEINTAQRNYITNYTQRMENALFSDNFFDEKRGWRRYVDEASWVDWYIACELFGNSDSWWSTYMYKERDEKFRFGPLWDFDIAFNNDYRIGNATRKYMRDAACEPKTWIKRWWEDESLHELVKNRWQEIGAENIRAFMTRYIDETEVLLDKSQQNNYEIWPTLSTRVHYEFDVRGSYEAEVKALRKYVNSRIDFLDAAWGVPAGIKDSHADSDIAIYPNLVEQSSDITIYNVAAGTAHVVIASVDGRIVASMNECPDSSGRLTIGCKDLSVGIYVVTIADAARNLYNGRLIVK